MSLSFSTPEWVHHAVFYQIFPDRFSYSSEITKPNNLEPWNSPPTPYGFKGGDLAGVADKLDYLQDLGITALYLNPIFQSASNHRYHTHDYYLIDPILGGQPAFDRLIKEAHRRNIRVVIDGVFNHASRGFFQFNHILELGSQSPYLDWFKVRSYPLHAYEGKPNYDCWWDLAALPTFNHENPQVQKFIFEVAKYWVDLGIDGWRLDVPFEIRTDGFWQEFRQVVKNANPDAYITGEIPWDASPWLQGDQFDGVMNYLMTYACWSFFGGRKMDNHLVGHWRGHGEEYFVKTGQDFAQVVTQLLGKYPQPAVYAQLNSLDSHDTARFLSITDSKEALRLATLFQMTYPGAPCVYYGDEIGMSGGKDPDCRRTFDWDEQTWDHELRAYFKECIGLRHAHPALRDGKWSILFADKSHVVYQRDLGEDVIIVAINNDSQTYHLDVELRSSTSNRTVFNNIFGTGSAEVNNSRLTGLAIPPFTGAVLN